jgi:putative membrane-bound dehydrogenase-like protein
VRPQAPEAERSSFRLVREDVTIELVAAEPQVASPVAMAWDADGFLYVAEMIDYPIALPAGRIRRLEDRDGDGLYERATIFAEGLAFPNSVLPCFGGLLVTAAPNIWFMRDTNGDGRADTLRMVLTGFGEGNTQLRVNGLFWGLDNWIYAANGRSDGEVRLPANSREKPVSIRRRDVRFRFRPETNVVEVEAVAGFSQFGLAHDDWGNRFPSWNTIPIRHVVLEQSALDRNPFLAETTSVASILDEKDGGRVYPISPVQSRFNRESVDYFNATCGPTIFRGDWLPQDLRGHAFVCEPLTNLVHHRSLEPVGCTFRARRVESGREFLASVDPAFRPVNLTTGPDGALYIVDMYREMVEHPDFVPADLRAGVEFRRWHDMGRIWRVRSKDTPPGVRPGDRRPRLESASSEKLVELLDHPVGWWRDTAQRLLVERQDQRVVPLLKERVRASSNPLCRLHVLWTLAGLNALDVTTLDRAAHDSDPGLREHALRASSSATMTQRLPLATTIAMADDLSIRVRLQAALALGQRGPLDLEAVRALVKLASRYAADPWMRLAVLSGIGESVVPFVREWLSICPDLLEKASDNQLRLLSDAAAIVGARRREPELVALLGLLETTGRNDPVHFYPPVGSMALVAGMGQGMDRSGSPLHAWLAEPANAMRPEVKELETIWPAAREFALLDRPVERRLIALDAVVRGHPDMAETFVGRLLRSGEPAELQSAAARAIVRVGGAQLTSQFLESWSRLSLRNRRDLLEAALSSPRASSAVIDALDGEHISIDELDAVSREALRNLPDVELRKRARAILARSALADRSEVVARYQAALRLTGDATKGAGLFAKNCQTCHQHQGQGFRVGPDLSGIAGRPPAVLLSDILDPNHDVAPDFVSLTIATRRGMVLSGLLVEETDSNLKIRKAEGIDETIHRAQIAEVRSSGRSLMPEGLEQSLNLQEMADLLAFLRSGGAVSPR